MSTAKKITDLTPLPVAQDDKVVMCGSGGAHTSTLEQLMKAIKANIKVGGRNYVRNSKGPFTEYQTQLELTDNFEGVNEYVISYDLEFENAQAGTAYDTCRMGVECMVLNANGTHYSYGATHIGIKSGESGKYRVTQIFYLPYGKRLANKCHVNVQLLGADKAQISNVKIEKGNIPTDWSPAPEDIMGGVIYCPMSLKGGVRHERCDNPFSYETSGADDGRVSISGGLLRLQRHCQSPDRHLSNGLFVQKRSGQGEVGLHDCDKRDVLQARCCNVAYRDRAVPSVGTWIPSRHGADAGLEHSDLIHGKEVAA